MNSNVKSWFLAIRPKTLTAAVVPIIVATALVKATGYPVLWWVSICALISSLFIQIGTNFVNDAIDFRKGADTETRIGPKRMTASGLLSPKQVMFAAGVCFALATAFGVPLVMQGGWPIVVVGVVSIFLGYAYTGGPFPLAYVGLGDLFVIAFFGVIAVTGTYYLHTHIWSFPAALAGVQIGCLAAVLIAVNNLRDAPQDQLVNKRTFAVRFGLTAARIEILILAFLPMLIGAYWMKLGFPNSAVLPILTVPIARRVVMGVFTNYPSPLYNKFLAMAALLHMVFGLLLAGAFWFWHTGMIG